MAIKEALEGVGTGAMAHRRRTFFLEFTIAFAVIALVLGIATGFAVTRYLGKSVRNSSIEHIAMRVENDVAPRIANRVDSERVLSPLDGENLEEFDGFIRESVLGSDTVKVVIWNTDGQIVYSVDRAAIGTVVPVHDDLESALSGDTSARVEAPAGSEQAGLDRYSKVLEVYTPLRSEGSSTVVGAVEVYQDYGPIASHIADMERSIYIAIGVSLSVLYLALVLLVRRGSNTIRRQQQDLESRTSELRTSYDSIVAVLCAALDLRDNVTLGHARRVSEISSIVAWQMGMRKEQLRQIEKAAILHDIGKIGVADAVLSKPGPLTESEWDEMKRHPELGYQILRGIDFLRDAAEVVYAHHERYDGSGYPRGLKADKIPIGARVFAVVDAYDAMTSHRPYRKAQTHRTAVEEIARNAGTQFDPDVVQAFLEAERRHLLNSHKHDQTALGLGDDGNEAVLTGAGADGD